MYIAGVVFGVVLGSCVTCLIVEAGRKKGREMILKLKEKESGEKMLIRSQDGNTLVSLDKINWMSASDRGVLASVVGLEKPCVHWQVRHERESN